LLLYGPGPALHRCALHRVRGTFQLLIDKSLIVGAAQLSA
jgi:hypothetical protein